MREYIRRRQPAKAYLAIVCRKRRQREAALLTSACRPAIAYSRVGTGRTPSAVPSSSNFPPSHFGSEPGLIARSYRAFSSLPTVADLHDCPAGAVASSRGGPPARQHQGPEGVIRNVIASIIRASAIMTNAARQKCRPHDGLLAFVQRRRADFPTRSGIPPSQ